MFGCFSTFNDPVASLISLPSAAEEMKIPLSRLRGWRKGKFLNPVAKIRGDAPGGGVFLFRRADIRRLVDDPPPRGRRPRKRGAANDAD